MRWRHAFALYRAVERKKNIPCSGAGGFIPLLLLPAIGEQVFRARFSCGRVRTMSTGDNLDGALVSGLPEATIGLPTVAVSLPPFCDRNLGILFLQAESQFHVSGITWKVMRYLHVTRGVSRQLLLMRHATSLPTFKLPPYITFAQAKSCFEEITPTTLHGGTWRSQTHLSVTQLLGDGARAMDDALLR